MILPCDNPNAAQIKYSRYHYDYHCVAGDEMSDLHNISLHQAGDILTTPGYRIGQHVQQAHEISYIKSGSGKYCVNGVWYPVAQGDVILTRRGDLHDGITSDTDPLRTYYVGFTFLNAQEPYRSLAALFERGAVVKISQPGLAALEPLFEGIFSELLERRDLFPYSIEAYLSQILMRIFRETQHMMFPRRSASQVVDGSAELAQEVLRYIDKNFDSIEKLSDLADVFRYSYSRLSHLFSAEIGLTLYEYYDRQRFDRATALLKEGRLSVTEIAETLRYSSLHAFSKAFSKRFGISPKEYQKTYQANLQGDPFYASVRAGQSGERGPGKDFTGNPIFCEGICYSSVRTLEDRHTSFAPRSPREGHL